MLSALDIVKKYDQHLALDSVSIDVPENCIFGLLGPNGAGKTSLIRIINRITAPDRGEVTLNGKPMKESDLFRIGYLPEERGLYRKMPIAEQVLYLARLKGLSRTDALRKIKIWFEKFDLAPWWKRNLEDLSKGMQQKVQFITTVIHEPELIILDEPFSGFDPVNANLVKNEILELRKKGATLIFSTHNMASVEELCEYIALINRSKKILDGSVEDIRKENKTGMYEIVFTGHMISFTNAIWTGCELVEHTEKKGVHTARVRLLYNATPNQLLEAVMPHVQVNGLKEIIPGMNEIFIKKVTGQDGKVADFTE